WIVVENANGTALGFIPKEVDKLGDLPITAEISEALVVRYTPSGTSADPIQALNARPLGPNSRFRHARMEQTYLSVSWLSPVKENEKLNENNFASLSLSRTENIANELVGSWESEKGPTSHNMWRVNLDQNDIIWPVWPTQGHANPELKIMLCEGSLVCLCVERDSADDYPAGWEEISLRFKSIDL
ncbi:hypothetical protein FRC01_014627, partial [Tulasnella sp. 417]